jgi:O-antigen ligase
LLVSFFPSRNKASTAAAWLVVALLFSAPVFFLVVENVGGVIWTFSVLMGIGIACTTYREWWPELRGNRQLLVFLAVISLYLAISVLSFLIDGSEFALGRIKRQMLLVGTLFIFLVFWRLRLRWRIVLGAIALNALIFGVYAIWVYSIVDRRADGEVHAVHFGNMSLFLGFASLALLPATRDRRWRILAIAGLLLGVGGSVTAGARGGWLAVPILLVVTLIMIIRALQLRRRTLFVLFCLIAIALTGLWHIEIVQKRINRAQKDLIELAENDRPNSIGFRLVMWEQAWLEIQEAPLLGTGFSGYSNRMEAAVASGELDEEMLRFTNEPHNEYLYQWATRGAVGLLVFLVCLAWAGWHFFRLLLRGDIFQLSVAQVGLPLIIIIAVGGLTITVIDQRAVIRFLSWILAVLMYGLWVSSQNNLAGDPNLKKNS